MVTASLTAGFKGLFPFRAKKQPRLTLYNGHIVRFQENVVSYRLNQKAKGMKKVACIAAKRNPNQAICPSFI